MYFRKLAGSLLLASSLLQPALASDDAVNAAGGRTEQRQNSLQQDGEDNSGESQLSRAVANIPAKNDQSDDELLEKNSSDAWTQLYKIAQRRFDNRQYEDAEPELLAAIKVAKHGREGEQRLVTTRLTLADLYSATDKVEDAQRLYEWCLNASRRAFGEHSLAEAHAQSGLALVLLRKDKISEAHQLCKSALTTRAKLLGTHSHDYGESLITMGGILSREGLIDDSPKFFSHGLSILAQSSDERQLDWADAIRLAAIYKQKEGDKAEAQDLFEQSCAIKDKSVYFDQSAHLRGTVRFQWEDGSPRSQEIPDPEVPLRYMCSKNIRVACTVIDLWELFGVLISVTNIGDKRADVGLGKVQFLRTTGDPLDPQSERLELVDPQHIDRIRREMDIWRLTANKPWLANMQKTRNIRGLVPAHGHDLFRGPNVFGVYGEWGATSRVLPERFQLEPSPENVEEQAQVIVDPSLVRNNQNKTAGLIPVSLEPFESRTGELFYMNPRCENVLLRVYVGNAVFEFPFKTPKRRTAT